MNRKQLIIAFNTLAYKEIVRVMRIWQQTLLPPVVTTSLYFIIFGKLIGSQISNMEGFSYIEYIVPGLIMLSIITNSYTNTVSSFFSAKFQKSIEELLVSPTPNWIILLGHLAGGVFRGMLTGIMVAITAMFFTKVHFSNIFLIIVVAFLSSMIFSTAGMINGIFAKKFDDISWFPTFILTPMIYLGGVFYSVDMLPEMWQKASLANPVLYVVSAFRCGFLGISSIDVAVSLAMMTFFLIALFAFTLKLLKAGVGIKE